MKISLKYLEHLVGIDDLSRRVKRAPRAGSLRKKKWIHTVARIGSRVGKLPTMLALTLFRCSCKKNGVTSPLVLIPSATPRLVEYSLIPSGRVLRSGHYLTKPLFAPHQTAAFPNVLKVSLLRELSRADFHAAFGWEDPRSSPPSTRLQRGADFIHVSSSARPGLVSPPYAATPITSSTLNGAAREVTWGQEVNIGEEGTPESASATSGLGFMSALQRALVRPRASEAGGRDGDGKEVSSDRHALELLSTLAACCEV